MLPSYTCAFAVARDKLSLVTRWFRSSSSGGHPFSCSVICLGQPVCVLG